MTTSRERVAKAIKGEVPDKIPKGELLIEERVIKKFLGKDRVGFEERYKFINELELDLVTIVASDLDEMVLGEIKKWVNTSLFVFALLDGPFETGLKNYGFQRYFLMFKKERKELKDFIGRWEEKALREIHELWKMKVDGIVLADDVAYNKGLLISPQDLKEYFWLSYEKIIAFGKKEGLFYFFHSDGNYRVILPDLINLGFAGIHCLERQAGMEAEEIQKEFGEALCLWGHLTTEDIVKAKNPREKEQLKFSIDELGYRGRFILGTNTGLYDGIDLEGIKILYRSF
ncbi:uroporphyrinogen decarboxylase family protein [Carboxydothermus pertinax]|uniref:Uroporphyrinogen decarboxylase (URO-D) domain-containing protein n=1 Tax=Carboxydothermus pertinax TaxID=870242 RepID=A0A1L8CVI7_9THEO|nr:uroporphyrinogen decarboxylase family protein [Carboxydothermus pertinax]GAV22912.1 hypothetical protein cpu_14220 [Carboxydothermus pertinax]